MRIQNKLFLSLVAICSMLVLVMLVLMQWSVSRGMLEYVNTREEAKLQPLLERLADYYQINGSWQALRHQPRQFERLLRPEQAADVPAANEPKPRSDRRRHPLRFSLLDAHKQLVLGRPVRRGDWRTLPILVDGAVVGWLALPSRKRLTEGYELRFVEQQGEALALIGLLVIGLALVFTFLLSRHLLKPISALAAAAGAMTQGDYRPALDVSRRDELGQLARDVSELATSLAQSEVARQRWFADVSHELRTPLAILYAEIEALLDGIRPLNTAAVRSLQQEVSQLTKLVDDLYTLSNAELGALQYHKTWLNLDALVAAQVDAHRSAMAAAGLEITVHERTGDGDIVLWADQTRLCQLLDNLLVNSRKYTDAPGRVVVCLTSEADAVIISVHDSAPGVPEHALACLFDHLYRVEGSRNRASGGSGLGLAICRRIVAAHGGEISAAASAVGGLAITITLPKEASR